MPRFAQAFFLITSGRSFLPERVPGIKIDKRTGTLPCDGEKAPVRFFLPDNWYNWYYSVCV